MKDFEIKADDKDFPDSERNRDDWRRYEPEREWTEFTLKGGFRLLVKGSFYMENCPKNSKLRDIL
jgi:hypothetical protein